MPVTAREKQTSSSSRPQARQRISETKKGRARCQSRCQVVLSNPPFMDGQSVCWKPITGSGDAPRLYRHGYLSDSAPTIRSQPDFGLRFNPSVLPETEKPRWWARPSAFNCLSATSWRAFPRSCRRPAPAMSRARCGRRSGTSPTRFPASAGRRRRG